LPDKAIDLVDEAASRIKMELDSKPTELDQLDRQILQLEIERTSLAKEKDAASKERLKLIDKETANLRTNPRPLTAQWQNEKAAVNAVSVVQNATGTSKVGTGTSPAARRFDQVRRNQYGKIPDLEEEAGGPSKSNPRNTQHATRFYARKSRTKTSQGGGVVDAHIP